METELKQDSSEELKIKIGKEVSRCSECGRIAKGRWQSAWDHKGRQIFYCYHCLDIK